MRTDIHAHIIPQDLMESRLLNPECEEIGKGVRSCVIWGNRINPVYTGLTDENVHLAYMKENGIDREILSIPPYLFGYHKDVEFCKEWSRSYNEALAAICGKHPQQFGGLENLTLPNNMVFDSIVYEKHTLRYLLDCMGE